MKHRLEGGGGLSFTEFSYQLLQAYDFFWLFQNKNVQLQIGGSDQWGNIVLGVELIHRVIAASEGETEDTASGDREPIQEVAGLTTPLLTESSGKKFGKSDGNAVWLDLEMTSAYELYQVLYHLFLLVEGQPF